MENITIQEDDLYDKYPLIGYGDEGLVFKYNNQYAIKIFTTIKRPPNISLYRNKLLKIKEMLSIKDPNCSLPLGFVTYDGHDIEGIYMPLVKRNIITEDFEDLVNLHDPQKVIEYLIKADKVLQRLHQKEFIVGDIKPDNILINEEEQPIFIDTDNYCYKRYYFDLMPDRATFLHEKYNTPSLLLKDNDIILYALMSLYFLTGNKEFNFYKTKEQISHALRKTPLDKETLKELKYILSAKKDKPYIGPILERVNPNTFIKR